MYAIDRIDQGNVVLMDDDGKQVVVLAESLSFPLCEGLVLREYAGSFVPDYAETEARRKSAANKLQRLLGRDKQIK